MTGSLWHSMNLHNHLWIIQHLDRQTQGKRERSEENLSVKTEARKNISPHQLSQITFLYIDLSTESATLCSEGFLISFGHLKLLSLFFAAHSWISDPVVFVTFYADWMEYCIANLHGTLQHILRGNAVLYS